MADTLPELLLHWAERTPDAVFLGEPDRDRTCTYGRVAGAGKTGTAEERMRLFRFIRDLTALE
jgi:hypothetical protein